MLINEILPDFLRSVTDPKDYAKSFAYYLDRKTSVARELREILLNVFRTGSLYADDGSIDLDVLPKSYWYTPVRCILDDSLKTDECEAVYYHALEVAKAINGLLDKDETMLYSCPINHQIDLYSASLKDILHDIDLDAYDIVVKKIGDSSKYVNLPFPVIDENGNLYNSGITVTHDTSPDMLLTRCDDSYRTTFINAFATLSSMTAECNKSVALSYVMCELGKGNSTISLTDIATSVTASIGVEGAKVLSEASDMVSIATESNTPIEDRIRSIVSTILDVGDEDTDISNECVDSSDFFSVVSSNSYSGTDMKAVWNMANCSGVFDTAFAIATAVVTTTGKLVVSALKGLYSLGSRLWKKYAQPAYISKDFVASELDTRENYCDIPFAYFGSTASGEEVQFSKEALASMVKYKLGSQSRRVFNYSQDMISLTASKHGPSNIKGPKHFTHNIGASSRQSVTSVGGESVQVHGTVALIDAMGNIYTTNESVSSQYDSYSINEHQFGGLSDGISVFGRAISNPLITSYGAIPEDYLSTDDYPFAVFNNGSFVGCYSKWDGTDNKDSALHCGKASGSVILLRRDYDYHENWSSNVTRVQNDVVVDLGGHSFNVYGTPMFRAQKKSSNSTSINVKNGSIVLNTLSPVISCSSWAGSSTTLSSHGFTFTFSNVTIYPTPSFTGGSILITCSFTEDSPSNVFPYDVQFDNCRIDLRRVRSINLPLVISNDNRALIRCSIRGGAIVTHTDSLTPFDKGQNSNANSFVRFSYDYNGSFTVIIVPSGTSIPTISTLLGLSLLSSDVTYDYYVNRRQSPAVAFDGLVVRDGNNNIIMQDMHNKAVAGSGESRDAWIMTTASLSATWYCPEDTTVIYNHGEGVMTHRFIQDGITFTDFFLHMENPNYNSGWSTKPNSCIRIPGSVVSYTCPLHLLEYTSINGWMLSLRNLYGGGYPSVPLAYGSFEADIADYEWRALFIEGKGYLTDDNFGTTVLYSSFTTDTGYKLTFQHIFSQRSVSVKLYSIDVLCSGVNWVRVYNVGSLNRWYNVRYLDDIEIVVNSYEDECRLTLSKSRHLTASDIKDAVLQPCHSITVNTQDISCSYDPQLGFYNLKDPFGATIMLIGYHYGHGCYWNYSANTPITPSRGEDLSTTVTDCVDAPVYLVDLDFSITLKDPSNQVYPSNITADVSLSYELRPSSSYRAECSFMLTDLPLIPRQTSRVYFDDPDLLEFVWDTDLRSITWWSVPLSSMSEEDVHALLSDIENPVDANCACVSRYAFGCIQLLNSPKYGLGGVIYGCPINHTYIYTSEGMFRFKTDGEFLYYYNRNGETQAFDSNEAGDAFVSILSDCLADSSPLYDDGEDGDVRAYRDMYAAKTICDMFMYMSMSQKEDFFSLFSSEYEYIPKILNLAEFNPSSGVTNSSFYHALLGTQVTSPSLFGEWMYSHLFAIISNKESYMRIYYKMFGSSPPFFPYIIGDRLQSPKWHVSTDTDIQSYVDKLCAAMVTAIAILAAVIIIGVTASKLKKAFKRKLNERVANETSLKNEYASYQTDLRRKQSALSDERHKLKQLAPGSQEYEDQLATVNELSESVAAVKGNMRACSTSLIKAQKSTLRWEKFAKAFGAKLDVSDQIRAAMADTNPAEVANDCATDDPFVYASSPTLSMDDLTSSLQTLQDNIQLMIPSYPDVDFTGIYHAINETLLSIATINRNGPLDM